MEVDGVLVDDSHSTMRDLRPDRLLGGARSLPDARLPRIEQPAALEVTSRTADLAEPACRVVGVERAGTLDVRIADADPVELYRTFVTVVLPARAVAERAPLPRGSGA